MGVLAFVLTTRGVRYALSAFIATLVLLGPASAEARRIALVIGNSAYASAELPAAPTAAADARLVGRGLLQAGFDQVDIRTNLSRSDLREALSSFGAEAAGSDEALIYFVGDGFELSGHNWLLPSDAVLGSPSEVARQALPMDAFVEAFDRTKGLKVLIIDAARPLPIIDQWKRLPGYALKPDEDVRTGLAGLEIADTLVVYSTKAGATALNENGPNGRFAVSLAKRLPEPGVEVRRLFASVHDDVVRMTEGLQEPSVYGTLSGASAYFVKPTPKTVQQSAEEQAWSQAQQTATSQSFGDYLQHFPLGRYWTAATVLQARRRAAEVRAGTRAFSGRTIHLRANGSGDFGTLQDAIAAAQDGDRIDLEAGTYASHLPLKISKSVLITGPPRGQGSAKLHVATGIWISDGSPQIERLTVQCGCLTAFSVTGGRPVFREDAVIATVTSTAPIPTAVQVSGPTVLTLIDSDLLSQGYAVNMEGGAVVAVGDRFKMSGSVNRAVINAMVSGRSAFVDNSIDGVATTFFGFNTGPIVFQNNQIRLSGVPGQRFGLFEVLNQANLVVISGNRVSLGGGDARWAGCLLPTQCPVKIDGNFGLNSSDPYVQASR